VKIAAEKSTLRSRKSASVAGVMAFAAVVSAIWTMNVTPPSDRMAAGFQCASLPFDLPLPDPAEALTEIVREKTE